MHNENGVCPRRPRETKRGRIIFCQTCLAQDETRKYVSPCRCRPHRPWSACTARGTRETDADAMVSRARAAGPRKRRRHTGTAKRQTPRAKLSTYDETRFTHTSGRVHQRPCTRAAQKARACLRLHHSPLLRRCFAYSASSVTTLPPTLKRTKRATLMFSPSLPTYDLTNSSTFMLGSRM